MSLQRAKLIGRSWKILDKLYDGTYYVQELAEELDKSAAAVSPFLKELREDGLITFKEGEGRRRYYKLLDECRRIVEVIRGSKEFQKTLINEEEFERLLSRIHNSQTQDLALEGLREMSTRHSINSDVLIKKVFKLIKSDMEIPLKMYRIFSSLCYEGRKKSLLNDELSMKIAYYALDRIRDNSVTREEKTEARDLWIMLDTGVGSNEIVDYCIVFTREELESEYQEWEQFIRITLTSALRTEEEREEIRQKLWILIAEEEEDVIKNRYETLLRYDVGLYNGALSDNI